jgi:hypothetical protein
MLWGRSGMRSKNWQFPLTGKKEIPLDYSLEIENEGLTRESMEKQKKFSFRRYPEIMEIKKNDKKL